MMRIAHNGRKIAMYLPDVVTLEEPRILIIFTCIFSSIGLELPKSGCTGATL